MEVTACRRSLGKLHDLVVRGHGRIQITRRGCNQVCVLISQAELESLERALEILSQTSEFQVMSGEITSAAAETTEPINSAASA